MRLYIFGFVSLFASACRWPSCPSAEEVDADTEAETGIVTETDIEIDTTAETNVDYFIGVAIAAGENNITYTFEVEGDETLSIVDGDGDVTTIESEPGQGSWFNAVIVTSETNEVMMIGSIEQVDFCLFDGGELEVISPAVLLVTYGNDLETCYRIGGS